VQRGILEEYKTDTHRKVALLEEKLEKAQNIVASGESFIISGR
jgi:hypothetical protein